VGWLERGKPFATCEVPEAFFEKLCQLLLNPWNPAYPAWVHLCGLCQFSGNGSAQWRDYNISSVSGACLFVPAGGYLYVSPSNIAHYINTHHYRPPDEFCTAVLGCPPMRSVAYLKGAFGKRRQRAGPRRSVLRPRSAMPA
jgi:hypothetical protein